jgi:von Willebrand factor type A domain
MMRRSRLGAFGAMCVILVVGVVATGVAPAAAAPSATAAQSFVAGSPTAIACGGSVDAKVTVTGQAGVTGQSTDVMLVLDLSGSTGTPPSKLADLKRAATDTLAALDSADGAADQSISGNGAGILYYHGSSATVVAPLGSSYATLLAAINTLPAPSGGSPHDVGIAAGAAALAASSSGFARSLVLVSDGQASGADLTSATNAATAAKTAGDLIVPFGLGTGTDVSQTNLSSWASLPGSYQSATAGPIDRSKLVADLGAAVATPVAFTVTEALGAAFAAAPLSTTTGTVTTAAGSLQWTGTLTGSQSATLTYRAARNGTDVFSPTTETVSTLGLVVTGGTAAVTPPASISIGVLPCGGTLLSSTTCTGAQCTATGSQGGQQFSVDAGEPAAGTSVILTGLSTTPPPGACPGFDASTNGVEFDISPLTAAATFQYTIPKASLGSRKWWQLDVCLGTNLKFTTAIDSIASLRPGARLVGGDTLPGRWWGLLPSIPRFTWIPGLGFVRGPWVTSRSVDRNGNATVKFVVPFVPGSAAFTTDGKPGYDPKRWG